MAENLLRELGLGEKEITIYLAILRSGKTTAAELSTITKINRTTVYAVAKELISKGIVAEDISTPVAHLLALPPKDLNNLVTREQAELENKKALVDRAVEELKLVVADTKYSIPKLVFIGEGEVEKYLYQQTPIWIESTKEKGGVWWGFQDPSILENYGVWIDWFWKKANKGRVELQLLTSDSAVEAQLQGKYPGRQVKFWKEGGQKFTSTIWVIGDYIVMVNTTQKPHHLVEIHDSGMAHNLREFFKGIWQNRVTHYSGLAGINKMDEDLIEYVKSLPAKDREILEYARIEDIFSGKFSTLEATSSERIKSKILVKQIAPATKEATKLMKDRQIEKDYFRKVLLVPDEGQSKNSIYLIAGNKVAFYFLDEQNNLASALIDDAGQANVQRELFNLAWESLDK
jgi:predicted DNA-binding transcriptional regulator